MSRYNAYSENCVYFYTTMHFSSHYTDLMENLPPGPVPHHLWRTASARGLALAGCLTARRSDLTHPPSCVEWTLLLIRDLHCRCCLGLKGERSDIPRAIGKGNKENTREDTAGSKSICKKKINLTDLSQISWGPGRVHAQMFEILQKKKETCIYKWLTAYTTNTKYFEHQKTM